MPQKDFAEWRRVLLGSGEIAPLRLGASQEDILALFGQPDRTSLEKKKGRYLIFRYADIEFHFNHYDEHRLFLIYAEGEDGEPVVSISQLVPKCSTKAFPTKRNDLEMNHGR